MGREHKLQPGGSHDDAIYELVIVRSLDFYDLFTFTPSTVRMDRFLLC